MAGNFDAPVAPASVEGPKKSNKTVIIIVVVIAVILLLCCCFILAGIFLPGLLGSQIQGIFDNITRSLVSP